MRVYTFVVDLPEMFYPDMSGKTPEESAGWAWVSRKKVGKLPLNSAFEDTWDGIDWDDVEKSAAAADVVKVGPKGYIHGWVFVGSGTNFPGDGAYHPDLGHGTISSIEMDHEVGTVVTHVDFGDKGDKKFEYIPGLQHPDLGRGLQPRSALENEPVPEYAKPHPTFDKSPSAAMKRLAAAFPEGMHKTRVSLSPRPYNADEHQPKYPWDSPPPLAQAIADYVSPSSTINKNLRKIDGNLDSMPDVNDWHAVQTLDKEFQRERLTRPAVVYRGFTATDEKLAQLTPGADFTDHGYTSTASDPVWAQRFAVLRAFGEVPRTFLPTVTPHGGKPVIMKINVPAGNHMIMGEHDISEYVLPRDTSFHVDDVSPDGSLITVSVSSGEPPSMTAPVDEDSMAQTLADRISGKRPFGKSQKETTPAQAERLAGTGDEIVISGGADPVEKKFNPLELRDRHGRWMKNGVPALILGHPKTAKHVITYVPGVLSTTPDGHQRQIERIHALKDAADAAAKKAGKNEDTAFILWGYRAPKSLEGGAIRNYGVATAERLKEYQDKLKAQNPGAHFTVVGHSYGSFVSGLASSRHGMKPDDLVLIGSPGVNADHVSELAVPPDHVWVGAEPRDGVTYTSTRYGLGPNPAHPDFGARLFASEHPQRGEYMFRHAHSTYFRSQSQAIPNMAAIFTGDYDSVTPPGITPDPLPGRPGMVDDPRIIDPRTMMAPPVPYMLPGELTGTMQSIGKAAWESELRDPHGKWETASPGDLFYHGSRAQHSAGDAIDPESGADYYADELGESGGDEKIHRLFFTRDKDVAARYGTHVYEVRPSGSFHRHPYEEGTLISGSPLQVVREVSADTAWNKARRVVDTNGQERLTADRDESYPAAGGGSRQMPDAPHLGELSPGGTPYDQAGGEPPHWQPSQNLTAWSEGQVDGAGRAGVRAPASGVAEDWDDLSDGTHTSHPQGGRDDQQGQTGVPPHFTADLQGPGDEKWPQGGHGTQQAGTSSPGGENAVAPSSSAVKNSAEGKVYQQLLENYPPDAIAWVKDAEWAPSPLNVAQSKIDDDAIKSWAASHQQERVDHFAKKIEAGEHVHPAVSVREPGEDNVKVIDGHHRALAYRKLGLPLKTWLGNVKSNGGPWDETHSSQFHHGSDPANKAATLSKDAVRYRETGSMSKRCGTCVMFRQGEDHDWCTLVKGDIDAYDVCDRWYPEDDDSKAEKRFNPLQLRDSHGRWTRGDAGFGSGSSSGRSAEPAGTVSDDERSVVAGNGFKINMAQMDGADPDLREEVLARTKIFASQFPRAASTLTRIYTSYSSDDDVYATTHYNPADGTSSIQLNLTYYGDKKKFTDSMLKMHQTGFHPLGQTQSVIDHELGHVLDNAQYDGSGLSMPSHSSAWSEFSVSRLGSYARNNRREAFAEGFSVWQAAHTGSLSKSTMSMKLNRQEISIIDNIRADEERGISSHLQYKQKKPSDLMKPTCRGFITDEVLAELRENEAE